MAKKVVKMVAKGGGGVVEVGPYELTFVGGYEDDAVEAELVSPLLDPELHPGCRVKVVFETESLGKKGRPRFGLDSFHVNSLLAYLRSQGVVRAALEGALPGDRAEWDVEGETEGKGLWACARVKYLGLRRRDSRNPTQIAEMSKVLPAALVKAHLAAMDPPETRTFFTVVLDCDWDDEHEVRGEFRDEGFLGLDHV